jgi:formimidoylglutamate deiminase
LSGEPQPAVQIVAADLTWTGTGFAAGVRLGIDAGGRIAWVGAPPDGAGSGPTLPVRELPRRALLPGFVTAHSHAFQRGLRGRGETFPAGAGSFWTWREAMYDLVSRLGEDDFLALCTGAFREMRAAGFTSVGEFHYIHHLSLAEDASDYALDPLILEAADRAGIRLVLIQSYYRTGGVDRPLQGGQRRFRAADPESYWRQVDRLQGWLRPGQTLAASVHSLRAGTPEDLLAVYPEARRRGLPFHIHVEEQVGEIEEVVAAYGKRPMALLLDTLGTADGVTSIHCTHTEKGDMDRYLSAGGTVCLCPLTEGNLGDGIADVRGIVAHPEARLAIGTDSNARISPVEEMRWMEYAQRLQTQNRGLLRDGDGEVGRVVLRAATAGGAGALGLPAGRIEPGCWADFALLDLDSPLLAGWTPETLLDSLVFGATESVVAGTCVGGRWEERTPCADATR